MANVTTYINKVVVPNGSDTITANLVDTVSGYITSTVEEDLTLKGAAGANSPSVIFQRGTLTDNYNDWRIQDRSGFLYFDQRGSGSSDFANQVTFNTSGTVTATTFSGQLSGTISSGTTATTQAATDNSTKVATTAFVKAQGYQTASDVSTALGSYVPTSRTVNGKALSSEITLFVSSTASTTNTDILKSATVSGKTLVLGATTLSIT